jgi:Fic family protein
MKKEYSDDLVVRMAHHSTAIEGNTLTQGETKSILIDDIIPRQMGNREFYEVFNYRNFIKYLDKNYKEKMTIEGIKEIHKILLENIRDDNGKFKKIKNIVLGASFTPTPPYMVIESLGNWIENLDFALKNAHSKEEKIGAIMESHLRFEHIHPFSDGNGRVGRALIVLYCLKENIPPIVIEKEQREQYIAALNNEDKKELRNLGIELSEKERIRQKLIKGMIRERQRGEVER